MDSQLIEELTAQLYRQRSSLLQSPAGENGQATTADDRESELEESAQIDRMNRLRYQLDERGHTMVRAIEAALERIAAGTYGRCRNCEEEISPSRLKVLPTATLCIDCAESIEKKKSRQQEGKTERPLTAHNGSGNGSYEEEEAA
jgi:DnaK suppressor protein